MRSPLQGGLPPAAAVTGTVVRIACDESGFSGTNLLRSDAPVITHASVDLSAAEAVGLITALRSRFRLSPHELKSGQFLRRPGADEAVRWFLRSLTGRAHVHLTDKEFFLATRVVDLLMAEPSYAAGTRLTAGRRPAAVALYRAGRAAGAAWDDFLAAFAELVRTRRRPPGGPAVPAFLRAQDALGLGLDPARVRELSARLDDDDRSVPPPLEPMLPALAETVLAWSAGRREVLVTHDEQSALTAGRLTRLRRVLAHDGLSPLAGLLMADSRDDPRVQVADLLAGVARRLPTLVAEPLLLPTSLRAPDAQVPRGQEPAGQSPEKPQK